VYVVLPLVGIAVLGTVAYHAYRAPPTGVAGGAVGPGAKGPGGPPGGPVAVEVATVASATIEEDVDAVGTLRSNEAVVVRPEI
jgi:membrane fusion protein (multidrug efflux system)